MPAFVYEKILPLMRVPPGARDMAGTPIRETTPPYDRAGDFTLRDICETVGVGHGSALQTRGPHVAMGGWVIKAYRVAGRGSCLEFGNRVIACPTRIFVVMPHGGAD